MTSESTRFLGQPSETKPTFGRACRGSVWALRTPVASVVAGGVTDFYSINFLVVSGVLAVSDSSGVVALRSIKLNGQCNEPAEVTLPLFVYGADFISAPMCDVASLVALVGGQVVPRA